MKFYRTGLGSIIRQSNTQQTMSMKSEMYRTGLGSIGNRQSSTQQTEQTISMKSYPKTSLDRRCINKHDESAFVAYGSTAAAAKDTDENLSKLGRTRLGSIDISVHSKRYRAKTNLVGPF